MFLLLVVVAKTLLRDTYHTLEDKQHHGSRNLDEEDDQHNTEELRGERIINMNNIANLTQISDEWQH